MRMALIVLAIVQSVDDEIKLNISHEMSYQNHHSQCTFQ